MRLVEPTIPEGVPVEERRQAHVTVLLPIIGCVFVAYLVIGLAMPVLPLYVHRGLGLSTFVVGLVSGSQFAAALLTRVWAGHFVDTRGAKIGVVVGLSGAVASGLLYLLSLRFAAQPSSSVAILLVGRAVLGAAESFIITGSLSWGLALLGAHNTGKVMSWVGTAVYAAFAVGAPLGTALYEAFGFRAVALAAAAIPLGTFGLVISLRRPEQPHHPHDEGGLAEVFGVVWLPGVGLALGGVGFGAITTFVVLLFAQHGWGPAWLAFTLLSVAFIAGRLFFGHLPDRIGGATVAWACVLVEALGLAMIWLSPTFTLALVGVTLSGFGYSLVYPGFGVEAVRRAPPQRRGLAMGAYTAFLDLSLGLTGPALGLVADHAGLAAVFLASTLVVLSSAAVAFAFIRSKRAAIATAFNLPRIHLKVVHLAPPARAGTMFIDLVQWVEPRPTGEPYRVLNHLGLNRLAFRVSDLDATTASLRGKGITFLSDEPQSFRAKFRGIVTTDPDGIFVQLLEALP